MIESYILDESHNINTALSKLVQGSDDYKYLKYLHTLTHTTTIPSNIADIIKYAESSPTNARKYTLAFRSYFLIYTLSQSEDEKKEMLSQILKLSGVSYTDTQPASVKMVQNSENANALKGISALDYSTISPEKIMADIYNDKND